MLILVFCLAPVLAGGGGGGHASDIDFPPSLERYDDKHLDGIFEIILFRAKDKPFNLVASLIFFLAIVHTFLSARLLEVSHRWEHDHEDAIDRGEAKRGSVHMGARLLHFLGEVEAIFGIWALALMTAIFAFYDWDTVVHYLSYKVNFTEALFVIAIMTLSSTRPILKLSELMMWRIANWFGGMLIAWWFTILTFGPILGSFITEPAAMTISALLLSQKFYKLNPKESLKYATLALLFVNVSIGGTLTHFAAPPVLMVAGPWKWDLLFMLTNFGWKAVVCIGVVNFVYYRIFREDLQKLQVKYAVVRLGDELRGKYMPSARMLAQFEETEKILENQLHFGERLDDKFEDIKRNIRSTIIKDLVGRDVDLNSPDAQTIFDKVFDEKFSDFKDIKMSGVELFEWAFEARFSEIREAEMGRAIPGLLPKKRRPRYIDPGWNSREDHVPAWMMLIHVLFMVWTVFTAHYPVLFMGGLLFFLGFTSITQHYQNQIDLKVPVLVGFFLGGLVIHGGVQAWWIEPVLGRLGELPLMFGAMVLTAFNDNAAITYLSTLVPNLSPELKIAVVAGAVTGGGLTVIANAPNPAGLTILKGYFDGGVSPVKLLQYALLPTMITFCIFYVLS
ncbi:putative Na+/H+ antiporter [Acanthopleuribacter pedis]|uniref:Putative Na+/H+ antiporter n=1 Tax=Acanthopleuribacter pedis TaxID=442870 RepID=A0A8J7Q6R9_9BACT|nr:putative Na+/H+ antiporter [Acanthopleuribacter pedis]MBO1319231.1 putative Na+/H+ antiporter [Acanthopleuribacter pedis]